MRNTILLVTAVALSFTLHHSVAAQGDSFGSSAAATAPQAQPPSKPAGVGAPTAGVELPPATDIFKRSVEAIGGEAAVRRHTAMRMKGGLSATGMKTPGTLEILMLAPNKFLTTIELPGMGPMKQGFDGNIGWTKNSMMGTQLLEGKTLAELRRSSDFYKDLDPSKMWTTATTSGIVDFGGMPCYEVAVTGDLGEGSLFYGVSDGLNRGMRLTIDSPMGKIPATTRMVEYKEFDGLKVASKTEIEAMGAVQTMTVDSIDFAPLNESLFDLPADVQALVKNGGAKTTGTTPPPAAPVPPPTKP